MKIALSTFMCLIIGIQLSIAQTSIKYPKQNISGLLKIGNFSCGYYGELQNNEVVIDLPRVREVDQIKKILSYTGLPLNFTIFRANIQNAGAIIISGERIILYDPNYLNIVDQTSNTYWSSISILAHEIGHHLSGHTLSQNGSLIKELEADKFSGFVLYKMGATVQQAITAMELYGSENASQTHPGKLNRITAIKEGWNEAANYRYNAATPPPPNDELSVLYSPNMFYEDGYELTQEYKDNKEYIWHPEIYSGTILEQDFGTAHVPWGSDGDSVSAMLILVHKKERDDKNFNYNYFSPGEKVWIIYDHPRLSQCNMADYRNFESLITPGREVTFSAIWQGGNSVGYFSLNSISTLPIKK